MRAVSILLLIGFSLITSSIYAEDAGALRERGIAALKESQNNPRAIVEAARCFAKAAEMFLAANDEEKAVEMNSFLYWCKKKMTLEDMDAFIKGGDAKVAEKINAVEKSAPKADESQKWFDRAEKFAKNNPNEHLLIAIRFYEVADRFKGSDASFKAQDRSLKEQLQDKATPARVVAPAVAAASSVPAPNVAVAPKDGAEKAAIPSADEIKAADKLIQYLFRAEYVRTDAPSRVLLSAKLLVQADENKSDMASVYVLLTQARELAVLANDAAASTQAQARFRAAFKQDFTAVMTDLRKLESSIKPRESGAAMAAVYAQAADEAVASEMYDQAVRFNSRAEDLLPMIKDPELKVWLMKEIPRVLAIKVQSAAATEAQKTLAKNAADPGANVVVGKFALLLGQFEKAFAMLAKGNDGPLSSLSRQELSPPQDAAAQFKLADEWFDRAEKEPSPHLKKHMQERASMWYATALPSLSGLAKLKVESRLKTLPAVAAAEMVANGSTGAAEQDPSAQWISKDATYTSSSIWPDHPPLPGLLDGSGGGYGGGPDAFAFSTTVENDAWIVIDLQQSYDLKRVDIITRRNLAERAVPMAISVGNSEIGPWTEVWRTEDAKPEYEATIKGTGRFVKILRTGRNHFHMYSVKIYGVDKNTGKKASDKAVVKPVELNGELLSKSFTILPGAYTINGTFTSEPKTTVRIAAGATVTGGKFDLSHDAHIYANGERDLPVVFKNVVFALDNSSALRAHNAIFVDCVFTKGGGFFGYFSTHWRLVNCSLHKCRFPNLRAVDYGFACANCIFSSMSFPEIIHDKDTLGHLRKDWNIIGGCAFVDCKVSSTVLLCSEACSYFSCQFLPFKTQPTGEAVLAIEGYFSKCDGKYPVDAAGEPYRVEASAKPHPCPSAPTAVPGTDFQQNVRIVQDAGKMYKWISKNATAKVSSQFHEQRLSAWLLNGEGGDVWENTHSFHTNDDINQFVVLDLGAKQSVAAVEISNRNSQMTRSKTLSLWSADSAEGPWTEIWTTRDWQNFWVISFETPESTRYLKIGLKEKNPLHLNTVRVFTK